MSKLYVASYGSQTVLVLTPVAAPGPKLTFSIEGINVDFHPVGLALDNARHRLYVTGANQVFIRDIPTHQSKYIIVGDTPLYPGLNPAGTRLYVPNSGSNTLSVIDTIADKVIDNITMGGKPFQAVVDPTDKYVYVTNFGSNTVSKVSTTRKLGLKPPKLPPGKIHVHPQPCGIAMDNASGNSAYVVCQSTQEVAVINTTRRRTDDYIPVQSKPSGIAIGRAPDQLWVTNRGSNSVSVLEPNTHALLTTIPNVDTPQSVSVLGPFAFVTAYNLNQLLVFDRSNYQQITTVNLASHPDDVIAA